MSKNTYGIKTKESMMLRQWESRIKMESDTLCFLPLPWISKRNGSFGGKSLKDGIPLRLSPDRRQVFYPVVTVPSGLLLQFFLSPCCYLVIPYIVFVPVFATLPQILHVIRSRKPHRRFLRDVFLCQRLG